jgi:1-deoxy-D-xylulose-5-phosphate reductoisomerase
MTAGGSAPAVFNAANEVAVAAFLAEKVPFLAIPRIVEQTLSSMATVEPKSLAEVIALDQEARVRATQFISHS